MGTFLPLLVAGREDRRGQEIGLRRAREVIPAAGLKHHRFFSSFNDPALVRAKGASDKEFLNLTFLLSREIINLLK